jgi:hypothetical protein
MNDKDNSELDTWLAALQVVLLSAALGLALLGAYLIIEQMLGG